MSCLDAATLWALHEGELQGDERTAALSHVRECFACGGARRDLSRTLELLAAAASAPPPLVRWRELDARLDDAVTAAAAARFRFQWPSWLLVPALATAAAIVVAIQVADRDAPPHRSGQEERVASADHRPIASDQVSAAEHRQLLDGAAVGTAEHRQLLDGAAVGAAAHRSDDDGAAVVITAQKPDNGGAAAGAVAPRSDNDGAVSGGQSGGPAVARGLAGGVSGATAPAAGTNDRLAKSLARLVAASSAATVQSSSGARVNGEVMRAGAPLRNGARIMTGSGGSAALALGGGSLAQLGGDASARVLSAGALSLEKGHLRLSAQGTLRVEVAGARIRASRDAVFTAARTPDLEVAVLQGAVLVEQDDGTRTRVLAGESVRVERGALVRASRRTDALETSAEAGFLRRAGASLKQGRCGEFLLGLQTLAFDAEHPTVRAEARILKARCHDERLEPQLAAAEYTRYLRDFPEGTAAAEARAALDAQR